MTSTGTITATERLKRALQKATRITSVPIEVLITSNTTHENLRDRLTSLSVGGLISARQAVIGVDPVNRHVALGLSPEIERELPHGERLAWLKGLQEDLHMTAFENAVGLGVLSLAFALSQNFPAASQAGERMSASAPHQR